MMISSYSSLLRDSLSSTVNVKYKILNLDDKNDFTVICEELNTHQVIELPLQDIIKNNKLKYFDVKDALILSGLTTNHQKVNQASKSNYLANIELLFIFCFLMSNVLAMKLVNIFGITFSAGMITFPMLYVLSDVVTEVYGFSASRKLILKGLAFNLSLTILLLLTSILPSNVSNSSMFDTVFALQPKVFLASLLSYLLGEFTNSYILALSKQKLKNFAFSIRAIFSTMMGSLVDTSIFFIIVFSDALLAGDVYKSIVIVSLIKVFYELLLLPVTVKLVVYLQNKNTIDTINLASKIVI